MLTLLTLTTLAAQSGSPYQLNDNPGTVSAMDIGDLNGDGIDDVVAAISDLERLVVFEGRKGHGRSPMQVIAPALVEFHNLLVEDLDGDGDGDVIAIDRASSRVFAYINAGGVNLMPAAVIVDFKIPSSSPADYELQAADTNGNGVLDVVITIKGSSGVGMDGVWHLETYPGTSGGGDLATTFGTAARFLQLSSDRAIEVRVTDMDADGDSDIVYIELAGGTVRWARNDGVLPIAPTSSLVTTIPELVSMDVGDLDADGHMNVLATSSIIAEKMKVVWGLGGGNFGQVVNFTNATRSRIKLQLADLTDDGIVDIVEEFTDGTGRSSLSWFLNLGFGAPNNNETFLLRSYEPLIDTQVGDFDGDGLPDIISAIAPSGSLALVPFSVGQIGWYKNEAPPATNPLSRQIRSLSPDHTPDPGPTPARRFRQ